ncbi:MAG TPA: hypothetical protein VFI02_17110 [Armatimonadota bacterium]|nr:hypothetical protein [Armatimonadota bacterium]
MKAELRSALLLLALAFLTSALLVYADSPVTDIVGGTEWSVGPYSGYQCGNVYSCSTDTVLTNFQVDLYPSYSSELRFIVYESTALDGTYDKICETGCTFVGSYWYGSGPLAVQLHAGRYYILSVSSPGWARCWCSPRPSTAVAFGRRECGYFQTGYPPEDTTTNPNDSRAVYQKVTTCQFSRAIAISSPNGSEFYQLGHTIPIKWTSGGTDWLGTDTVRLEYSRDAGSTWNPIVGAESLAYDSGTFDWDTTGIAASTQCRVRVVFNDAPAVSDASDASFTIGLDLTGPTIQHSGPWTTSNLAGPYRISARVTDPSGVGDVTLYWNKNTGTYSSISMTISSLNTYYGEIPGPSAPGDTYHYYLQARDSSTAQNVSKYPAGAPGTVNSFSMAAIASATIGSTEVASSSSGKTRGNVYAPATNTGLSSIEDYLNLPSATELRFFIYEQGTGGTFNKIAENVVPSAGPGLGWYSSGPMSAHLVSGKSYIMGVACQGSCTFYWASTGQPVTVPFGQSVSGYGKSVYPPPATTTYSYMSTVTYQRVNYLAEGRSIRFVPTGPATYEPGMSILLQWLCTGCEWATPDTVRLEYTNDNGTTWHQIPGAENIPYNLMLGSSAPTFSWDTTGLPVGSYKVRVAYEGDPGVNAVSDVYTLQWDTTPPVITHTPLTDTYNLVGPYYVSATLSDTSGVSSFKLYWSRNGGPFSSVGMYTGGGPWSAGIPGPSAVGDRYCYYLEAIDKSVAANVGRSPAGAPADLHCFSIPFCMTEMWGNTTESTTATAVARGNLYLCSTDVALTSIDMYLNIPTSTELRFFVYEAPNYDSSYTKIHETTIANSGTGQGWYSSGPIATPMVAGKYYIIGAAWQGNVTYYDRYTSGDSSKTAFGTCYSGTTLTGYPPPAILDRYSHSGTNTQYYERLTTCKYVRAVEIRSPDGGELYDPCHVVPIRWTYPGSNWIAGDTVRLEYSTDGGATWNPIVGAENIPYNAGTFDWDTTGVAESEHCRVRVNSNADASVTDASDYDFFMRVDRTQPVIVHTPPMDTGDLAGPYPVLATVTDAYGVGSVTCYWSKNEGPFNPVVMTPTTHPNEYSGSIPGPSLPGDRILYYIEAAAASCGGSTGRNPASALANLHGFMILLGSSDTIGGATSGTTRQQAMVCNSYICTEPDMAIWQVEEYLRIGSTPTELRFAIYESNTPEGIYTKIHETVVPDSGPAGDKWCSSGPIMVPLTQGKYYLVLSGSLGSTAAWYATAGHPTQTAFGHSLGSRNIYNYPPPATQNYTWPDAYAYYQRIGSCKVAHAIAEGKQSPAGRAVRINDRVVSAAFDGRFYAQCPDRSSGIGVLWNGAMPVIGDEVSINGATTTLDGERLIGANSLTVDEHGDPPVPVTMGNLQIGGSDFFYAAGPPPTGQKGMEGCADLNNIGLLVTTYGRVLAVGSDFFYIDDGSHVEDHSIFGGLRVLCPGLSKPASGKYVAVTGISSPLKVGDGLFRSIRVRGQGDIRVIAGS